VQIAFFCGNMMVLGKVYVAGIEESIEMTLLGVVENGLLVADVVRVRVE